LQKWTCKVKIKEFSLTMSSLQKRLELEFLNINKSAPSSYNMMASDTKGQLAQIQRDIQDVEGMIDQEVAQIFIRIPLFTKHHTSSQ